MARLRGIEPPHTAPEAAALSVELQAHVFSPLTFILSPEGRGINLVEVKGEEDLAAGGEATEVLVAQI